MKSNFISKYRLKKYFYFYQSFPQVSKVTPGEQVSKSHYESLPLPTPTSFSFLYYLGEMRLEMNFRTDLTVFFFFFFLFLKGFKRKHAATGVGKLGIMGFYRLIVCTHKRIASFSRPAGWGREEVRDSLGNYYPN